jgi:hypothetical protein
MDWTGSATAYLEDEPEEEEEQPVAEEDEEDEAAAAGEDAGSSAGSPAGPKAVASPRAAGGGGWGLRAWGLGALSELKLESVSRLAAEALQTVRRDVSEFQEALSADAKDLAVAGAAAAEEALPELRATAAGLQEKLEVVGEGIEHAGASLFANIAQVCVCVLCCLLLRLACCVAAWGALGRGRVRGVHAHGRACTPALRDAARARRRAAA